MSLPNLKHLFLNFSFNGILFLILVISIQNSSTKNKVNFIFNETINLPISFIIGTSFISGSLIGNFISFKFPRKK